MDRRRNRPDRTKWPKAATQCGAQLKDGTSSNIARMHVIFIIRFPPLSLAGGGMPTFRYG